MFKFFEITGHLLLCLPWIWQEDGYETLPSPRGIFYPSPRPQAPVKLNKPLFCLSTAFWVSLLLNFPTNWALKGKQGSGQKAPQSNLGQYGFFINLQNATSTFDQTLILPDFNILRCSWSLRNGAEG